MGWVGIKNKLRDEKNVIFEVEHIKRIQKTAESKLSRYQQSNF